LLRLAAELTPTHARAAELSERLQAAVNRQAAAEAVKRLKQKVAAIIRGASRLLHPPAIEPASSRWPCAKSIRRWHSTRRRRGGEPQDRD